MEFTISPTRFSSAARRSGVEKSPPSISRDQITSAGEREIIGVLSLGKQRKAQTLSRGKKRQREIGRAKRRLLPGAIAVETQDRLIRHLPEQAKLVFREREIGR